MKLFEDQCLEVMVGGVGREMKGKRAGRGC